MRVLAAFAATVLCIAGVTLAEAADMPAERSVNYSIGPAAGGQRAEPLVFYDYQPGTYVRAYWTAPWRHHRYFPMTGERPEIGRDEDLSAPSRPSKPGKTFKRSWSNASAFVRPVAQRRAPDKAAQAEPHLPPLK